MLSWKLQGGVEHWSSIDDITLLETLSRDMEAEDEEEIDWAGLVKDWERWVWSGYSDWERWVYSGWTPPVF